MLVYLASRYLLASGLTLHLIPRPQPNKLVLASLVQTAYQQ